MNQVQRLTAFIEREVCRILNEHQGWPMSNGGGRPARHDDEAKITSVR
ncbi:MAG: hypothetical protein IIC02_03230 [Planctomycetes bacterium]|nr:hypothetical protein [Planctomycetota bacterium]